MANAQEALEALDEQELQRTIAWVEDPTVIDPLTALDKQEGGDHYTKLGMYQPWIVMHRWMNPDELRGYAKGTAIAYLAREQDKGGDLDIKKAIHTLQIYLELTEGENEEA